MHEFRAAPDVATDTEAERTSSEARVEPMGATRDAGATAPIVTASRGILHAGTLPSSRVQRAAARPRVGPAEAVTRIRRSHAPTRPASGGGGGDRVIRRTGGGRELTSKTVTKGLVAAIPVIQTELAKNTAQGPTMAENVATQLALFDKHLKRKSRSEQVINEAIRLATVIDATAGSLAMSIGDPSLKARIATELIAAFRAGLTQALAAKKDDGARTNKTDRAITIASAIVGDDPLLLYMNNKVQLADAAWRVRTMGEQATLDPREMYRILKDRFMMYLGSFTENQVKAGERKNDEITSVDSTGAEKTGTATFELKDLVGELSLTQLNKTVKLDRTKKNAADKPPPWLDGELSMTPGAIAKLGLLETAVSADDLKQTKLTPEQLSAEQDISGKGLTEKQSEHFHRLRAEEIAGAADYEANGTSPREYCIAKLVTRYGIDRGRAKKIIGDFITALGAVPLTLTNDLEGLFAKRDDKQPLPKYGSEYKSEPSRMQKEVDVGQLIGRPGHDAKAMAMGSPDPTFTKSRGTNYMRWRRDKDERETGYHGLSADDLPTFGAVNPNFMHTKGGNANFAEWDLDAKEFTGTDYGKNYYGDVHFLLRDEVRARSTFIARGKVAVEGRRIERTDLVFLLADMIRLYMWDYVDAIVADTQLIGKTVLTNMDAEVHIYGKFDLAKDVEAMYMLPDAFKVSKKKSGGAAYRARKFAEANRITVKSVGKRPDGYQVYARQGVNGGIDLSKDLNA